MTMTDMLLMFVPGLVHMDPPVRVQGKGQPFFTFLTEAVKIYYLNTYCILWAENICLALATHQKESGVACYQTVQLILELAILQV